MESPENTARPPGPPLSVVLPVRNRRIAAFTLKFLEHQLTADDELLISFNQTDPEVADVVLEQAARLRGKLTVLRWEKIIPLYPHWRVVIEAAAHDAVLFVHDDDVYHGRIVELVRGVFAGDPDASFVTSQMVNISLAKDLEIRSDGDKNEVLKYNWLTYFHEKRADGFIAQFNTSFYGFRKSRLKNFDLLGKNPICGDFLLFYSGLTGGNLHVLPEFLAARLQHGENAVYNEFFKTGHSMNGFEVLFERAGLSETPEGREFLAHMRDSFLTGYLKTWKAGILCGVDPRKLVVVCRRIRRLAPGALTPGMLLPVRIMMAARRLKWWIPQNRMYVALLGFYRRLRGPSRFYSQFPKLEIEEFASSVEQPVDLIKSYLAVAHSELGSKR